MPDLALGLEAGPEPEPEAGYSTASRRGSQWRQREYNFGGDAEGIKELLHGIRKTVSLLDDNVGAIEIVVSPCEVCAKATEL